MNRLGALISICALAACAWWASRQAAPQLPESVGRATLVVAAVALYAVITLIRGWRWTLILRRAGVRHRDADAFGLTVVGYMGNAVLPARGGEVLRIMLLAERTSAKRREILGSIIPERVLDAATLVVLFALFTALGTAGAPIGRLPSVIAVACSVLALGGLVLYERLRNTGRFAAFADRVRPIARASKLLLRPVGLALGLATVVIWLLEGGVLLLVAESLGLSIGLLEATFAVVIASFMALVPAGPGYVGTYDAALLFAFDNLGIAGGAAVGLVLLFRFVIFVPITLAGFVLVLTRYGGLGALLPKARRSGLSSRPIS